MKKNKTKQNKTKQKQKKQKQFVYMYTSTCEPWMTFETKFLNFVSVVTYVQHLRSKKMMFG